MNAWLMLAAAIAAEIVGTSALKASQGLSKLLPTLLMAAAYLATFALLSASVRTLPLGNAYAVWAGAGTVGVALVGWALFGEAVGLAQLLGIALIVVGTIVLKSVPAA